jgi:mannose-6-phosphate isomerase-like protein (cupin superfamily)
VRALELLRCRTRSHTCLQPLVASPEEGDTFTIGELRIVSRVQGSQSGGGLELHELALGRFVIDYHVHRTMDETRCVIEGQVEFIVAGRKYQKAAGSVVFVPRGVHHGFSNQGPGRARVFVLFTPAGSQHEYFRRLEELVTAPGLDKEAVQQLQKQYDQELVPLDS